MQKDLKFLSEWHHSEVDFLKMLEEIVQIRIRYFDMSIYYYPIPKTINKNVEIVTSS